MQGWVRGNTREKEGRLGLFMEHPLFTSFSMLVSFPPLPCPSLSASNSLQCFIFPLPPRLFLPSSYLLRLPPSLLIHPFLVFDPPLIFRSPSFLSPSNLSHLFRFISQFLSKYFEWAEVPVRLLHFPPSLSLLSKFRSPLLSRDFYFTFHFHSCFVFFISVAPNLLPPPTSVF